MMVVLKKIIQKYLFTFFCLNLNLGLSNHELSISGGFPLMEQIRCNGNNNGSWMKTSIINEY